MIERKIFGWSATFIVVTGLVKGAQFGLFTYLASVLDVKVYGAFGLIYAYQSAVTEFSGTGLKEKTIGLLSKYESRDRRTVLFKRNAGLFLLISSVAIIVIGIIALISISDADLYLELVLGLVLGTGLSFSLLQGTFLRLVENYFGSLIANYGVLFFSILGMGMGYLAASDLEAIFLGGILGAIFGIFILMISGNIYLGKIPQIASLSKELSPTLPYIIIGIFGWISGYGINVVIDQMLSIKEVAMFTFLLTVSSLAQMIASSMNMVWTPKFYNLYNSGEKELARKKNWQFFTIQAFVVGLVSLLAIYCLDFLGYLSNNLKVYTDGELELSLLFVSYILVIPWWQGSNYYYVDGEGNKLLKVSLIGGGIGLTVWLILIYFFESFGIYLGFAINGFFKSLYLWYDCRKYWGVYAPWSSCIFISIAIIAFTLYIQ